MNIIMLAATISLKILNMSEKTTIGRFIIKTKCTPETQTENANCDIYKVKHPRTGAQLMAKVHRLSNQQICDIEQGYLGSVVTYAEHAIELFFTRQADSKRLVLIGPAKEGEQLNQAQLKLSELTLNAEICSRLVVETIDLITDLHSVGITLACPLQSFLQLNHNTGELTMMKFSHRKNSTPEIFRSISYPSRIIDSLAEPEVEVFRSFLKHLLALQEKDHHEEPHSKVVELLKLTEQTTFKLSELQRATKTLLFRDTQWWALLILDSFFKDLTIQLSFKASLSHQKTRTFCIRFINIGQQTVTGEQLFYNLSGKQQDHLRVVSPFQFQFWDVRLSAWKKVHLRQEQVLSALQDTTASKHTFSDPEQHSPHAYDNVNKEGSFQTNSKNTLTIQRFPRRLEQKKQNTDNFPQICIVEVCSRFEGQGVAGTTVQGVGSLVAPQLVLTCAHLLYGAAGQTKQRMLADSVTVIVGREKYEVKDWRHPYQFPSYDSKMDFALLLLSQPIKLPRYLCLARNFKSKHQIDKQCLQIFPVGSSLRAIFNRDGTGKVILASRRTFTRGNADHDGAPYTLDLQWGHHYIVAIKSQPLGGGVMMNEGVVERISLFQNQLMRTNQSRIWMQSVDHMMITQTLQSILKHYKELATNCNTKQQGQQMAATRLQPSRLVEGFLPLSKHGETDIDQLLCEYPNLYKQYCHFVKYESNSPLRAQLLTRIKACLESVRNVVGPLGRYFRNLLHKMVDYLNESQHKSASGQAAVDQLQSNTLSFQESYREQAYQWELMALWLKYCNYEAHYGYLKPFFLKYGVLSKISLNSTWKASLLCKSIASEEQYNKAVLMTAISNQQMQAVLPLQPANVTQQFPGTTKSPFSSFQCNGLYQLSVSKERTTSSQWTGEHTKSVKYYEFEAQVRLPHERALNELCWQHIKWVYPNSPFVYLKRTLDHKEQQFRLTFKFVTPLQSTILDSLKVMQKQHSEKLAYFLLDITGFLSKLHAQQVQLCSPVQFCCLVDLKRGVSRFWFFGHWQALVNQILNMKPQQREAVKNYYPVSQILSNRSNKAAFKQIDVWMLGKSLERIMNWLASHNEQMLWVWALRPVVAQMTAPPSHRVTSAEADEMLLGLFRVTRGQPNHYHSF